MILYVISPSFLQDLFTAWPKLDDTDVFFSLRTYRPYLFLFPLSVTAFFVLS